MALAPGSRLGHYDVTDLLGEGGMGQVWRATDTQLNRQVALKILPDAFADDPDRLARFQREAQILASLNHPSIAQIHGIEEAEGTRALVLELVEGPTLADRIANGPIPLDEALPIARQIAEALEAAHEAGVIHRDLKPANIKVREDGTVKVLDFGLAKALDPSPAGDPSQSPTLTAAATQVGIMGTAAYMSPEQARGKPVDKRADIWAFGVVLYEMLAGARPFQGEDVSLTLASVMRSEIDAKTLPQNVPVGVLAVLRRCLQKDPRQRIRDIGDVRLALAGDFPSPDMEHRALPGAAMGWPSGLLLGLGGLVLGALAATLGLPVERPLDPVASARFPLDLPAPPLLNVGPMMVAISPDGRTLVFAGRDRLYRRELDQLDWQPIPGTENGVDPMFSPDGRWLAFENAEGLQRMPAEGGPTALIVEGAAIRGAAWAPDDSIVFSPAGSGMFRVPLSGGEPEPVTMLEEGQTIHLAPNVLPGGEAVLFSIRTVTPADDEIAVASLDGGEVRSLLRGTRPRYVATGHVLFMREDDLWAVGFDPDRLEVLGQPVPILEDVQTEGNSGYGQLAVSDDGTLIYIPRVADERARRDFVWVSREGRIEPLETESREHRAFDLSPDGTRVAVSSLTDIWVYDLQRGGSARLTFGPEQERRPTWSPDGARVAFTAVDLPLSWKAADGTGEVEPLGAAANQVPTSFTSDGTAVVFEQRGATVDIGVMNLGDDRRITWLLDGPFNERDGALSPDDRWLAYSAQAASTVSEILVRPFPDVEDGSWQVSTDGGRWPVWNRADNELFYATGDGVMAARYETEPSFTIRERQLLFRWPFESQRLGDPTGGLRQMSVSPDGERFLLLTSGRDLPAAPGSRQLIVVQHWFEELKARVPIP